MIIHEHNDNEGGWGNADNGNGLDPPIFGWPNLWTAPYYWEEGQTRLLSLKEGGEEINGG